MLTTSHTPAYAAFVWSLVFVIPHAYWALGGTAGLEGDSIDGALAVVNYAAIVLSLIAAAIALALARPWGALVPRRVLLVGSWVQWGQPTKTSQRSF